MPISAAASTSTLPRVGSFGLDLPGLRASQARPLMAAQAAA
jgi:hypothetical protein